MKTAIFAIVFSLCCFSGHTQPVARISLQQALEAARSNNKALNVTRLQEHYRQLMSETGYQLPKTELVADLGQVNSKAFDNKISLSQRLSPFSVYKREKQVLLDEWASGKILSALKQATVDQYVRQAYLQLQYLNAKARLLQKTDSLFVKTKAIAALRHQQGESTILEKTTLDNEYAQIRLQEQLLDADKLSAQAQLAALLNQDQLPDAGDTLGSDVFLFDTALLAQHPYLQYYQQEVVTAGDRTLSEKAKLSPDLLIGIANQSFVGWQADRQQVEHYYDWKNRFSSGQIGVAVPLFNKAQKMKVKASQLGEKIAQANLEMAQQQLSLQLEQSLNDYRKNQYAVRYFEKEGLAQAELIFSQAGNQYRNGEINYLDWMMLVRNAIHIQNQYIDQVNTLQASAIQLRYLLLSSD